MNFHILAKKNFGPGVANSKFTTVRPRPPASFPECESAALRTSEWAKMTYSSVRSGDVLLLRPAVTRQDISSLIIRVKLSVLDH